MKVLYIGVYKDGTGWSHAAIDYILALDAAGVDVVCRPIKLNNMHFPAPSRIQELEKKSSTGADVVIQHVLPHMMEYDGRFKINIGLCALETSTFKHTMWPEYFNLMDRGWLISKHSEKICRDSDITIPLDVIGQPTDVHKYERAYPPLDVPSYGDFVFYTIADVNTRKNLSAIVRAFHTEFDREEPVSLLIKGNKYDAPIQTVLKEIQTHCEEVKKGLSLYPKIEYYKQEIIVPNVVSDEEIMKLHATCDCFVSASCGEAWCIPAFDAMAMGKTPIVTKWGGFTDYVDNEVGWLVDCNMQQAFSGGGLFANMNSGHEEWAVVNIRKMQRAMREAYENNSLREQKSQAGIEKAKLFSYEAIGPRMKELLENYVGK